MLTYGPHAESDPGLKLYFNGVTLVEWFQITVYQKALQSI